MKSKLERDQDLRLQKVLQEADDSSGKVEIIQEIIIFRCKNGINDYFIADDGGPGYDYHGFPLPSRIASASNPDGVIEAIDISDLTANYSFNEENQSAMVTANLEIANIDSLFNPENVSYLDGVTDRRLRSYATVPDAEYVTNDNGSPRYYHDFNPNYFMNDPTKFNPLFRTNHIVKIREGTVTQIPSAVPIEWEDKFLGLVSVVNPGGDGGQPKLSVTCHDFMKLLTGSSCERSYLAPIRDVNVGYNNVGQSAALRVAGSVGPDEYYYFNQSVHAPTYGKAPSGLLTMFQNGFNKSYKLPDFPLTLTSHNDDRTWSYQPLNADSSPMYDKATPYWSNRPEPEVYIAHRTISNQHGFIVRYYDGMEPKGQPTAVLHQTEVRFGVDGKAGYIPPNSNIARADNWCAVIEADIGYASDNEFVLYSVIAEGGVQVFWDQQEVANLDKCRVRADRYNFSVDINGFPIPTRVEQSSGESVATGFVMWSDATQDSDTTDNISKRRHLKIIYKCGENYGTPIDFSQKVTIGDATTSFNKPGWRNIFEMTAARSGLYPDVTATFPYLSGRLVEDYSAAENTETYGSTGTDAGKWIPSPTKKDFPSYVRSTTWSSENDMTAWLYGPTLGSDSNIIPYCFWKIDPEDSEWGYEILYTRGYVELKKPADLGPFSICAKYCYKEIGGNEISVKNVIEDIIIEDVFGVSRYVLDGSSFENNQDFFSFIQQKVFIPDASHMLDAIKLDSASTKNGFDAIQKVLQSVYSNFKVRCNPRGEFIGEYIIQKGAPLIEIREIPLNSTSLITAVPKSEKIEDLFFFSLSAIGLNKDQDPDESESTFRRETFIAKEIGIDRAGLTLKDYPGYKAPGYDRRYLALRDFGNMTYDVTEKRFVEVDQNGNIIKFISNLALYLRSYNANQWNWGRYEISTEFDDLEFAVYNPNNSVGYDRMTLPNYAIYVDALGDDAQPVLYYMIRLDKILDGTRGSNPDLGNIVTFTSGEKPKVDLVKEELGSNVSRTPGETIQGAPLLIDYDFKLNLISTIDIPVDDSDQITKFRVNGKRRFSANADLLEELARDYSDSPETVILTSDTDLQLSPSEILKGISGKRFTVGSRGLTQGWTDDDITTYKQKEFLASYKSVPPVEANTELLMPGILASYGEFVSQTSNPSAPWQHFGFHTNWSALTEYWKLPSSGNFELNFDATNGPESLIAGPMASRVFHFRVKVTKTYEYEFKIEADDMCQVYINGGGLYNDNGHGVLQKSFELIGSGGNYIAARAEQEFISFKIVYANSGGAGKLKLTMKNRAPGSGWKLDEGWNNYASAPVPLNVIYAGTDPRNDTASIYNARMRLNAVQYMADPSSFSSTGEGNTTTNGFAHDLVAYNYGKLQTFCLTNVDAMPRIALDSSAFWNLASTVNGLLIPMYNAPINQTYGISAKFDNNVIGMGFFVGGSRNVSFTNDGSEYFPVVKMPGSNALPTMADYQDSYSTDGIVGFDLDLQYERNIGEIGVLVGFPPAKLTPVDTESQLTLTEEYGGDVEFARIISRNQSNTPDTCVATGLIRSEYDPDNADDYTIPNLNGGSTTFVKHYDKGKPETVEPNPILSFFLRIEGRKDEADEWKPLVDWQKVNTRAEFFKFNFDNNLITEYRYLRFRFKDAKPIPYQSFVEEDSFTTKLNYNAPELRGLVTGPQVKVADDDITHGSQLYIINAAKRNLRFINVNKIYIYEKEDVYAVAYAETDITSKWYNPMLVYSGHKVKSNGDIINHNMGTSNSQASGKKSECLNLAMLYLNDGIRPKESISVNVNYNPNLKLNQTVWVTMGAHGGYFRTGEHTGNYHPGKLMLVDKIARSKQGVKPGLSLTLRNYR